MSNYVYDTSSAFDSLKNTRETLSVQYSTRDYVGAMEALIFNAVRPLVLTSKFSDTFISGVASWYSSNSKRRISRLEKCEFFGLVAQMLITEDTEIKIVKLKQMQLERTVLFYMIDLWLQSLNGYSRTLSSYALTKDKSKRASIDEYEYKVGKRKNSPVSLYSAIRDAKFWLLEFLRLKKMILEKYHRLVITSAQKDYKAMGHKVNLNDLIQNYMMTASRALDKCDFTKGTLTSYIQLWMKNARSRSVRTDSINSTETQPELGTQYIDDDSGNENSVELSLDTSHSSTDHIHNVRYLIKLVDPSGVFRLLNGIDEALFKEEKYLLKT